jgi:NAD(P)-dependent dehydrogenase (short-subunit alcohol dehydrogenase family)
MTSSTEPLAGQVAVVTGGSGGFGLAAAATVRSAGAAVALWGRNPDRLASAAKELESAGVGGCVVAVTCDVTQPEAVASATARTMDDLGRIDIGIVNAGLVLPADILQATFEDWRRVHAVNLDGAFLTLQSLARVMVDQREGGAFCVISSIAARRGAPHAVAYTASKAGLVGLTRSAAAALAPHRIRANAVLPGFVRTHTDPDPARDARDKNVAAKTPVGRLGEPSDFAAVLTYLSDKRHVFHTGDAITVDGGYLLD